MGEGRGTERWKRGGEQRGRREGGREMGEGRGTER